MAGLTFDVESAKRIARAVLASERRPANNPLRQRPLLTPSVPERWYTARNDNADELPAYGVAEVTGEDVVGNEIVYTLNKLTTTWPKRVAILGENSIAPGGYGAITFDPTFALCDSASVPAANECWGIKPNETKLFKGFPGFRSLGRAEGSGSAQRALVRQAWPQILWAHSASGIAARSGTTPGSATVTVYTLASGSLASTGFSVTAKNASAAAVAASAYIQIVEIEDDWAANYEDCGA